MVSEELEVVIGVRCLEPSRDFGDNGVEDRNLARAHFFKTIEKEVANIEVYAHPGNNKRSSLPSKM
jgi:hypothetical protein